MKWKYFFLILFLISTPFVGHSSQPDVESGTWWGIQLEITVNGNYRYFYNNNTTNGEYSFKIVSTAAMEPDKSGDFILYQGDEQIPVINWQEKSVNKENGAITDSPDLVKTMLPGMSLNYVIKKNGKLYFDFAIFLKTPTTDHAHPFKQFLLPRSALDQNLDPKNNYNKDVRQGSNGVELLDQLYLNQEETVKTFDWQWQRENPDFFNSHSVVLELKIIKKSPGHNLP